MDIGMNKPELGAVTGFCRFCGQSMMVVLDDSVDKGEIQPAADEAATRSCSCRKGEAYREEVFIKEEAEKLIGEMLDTDYPEIAEVFREAIPFIWGGSIKRLICTTDHNGQALIFREKNGIKIKTSKKLETEAVASY